MSGILGPGYLDFSLEMTREGDPSPYVVTWACQLGSPPYTATQLSNMLVVFENEWADVIPDSQTIGPLNVRVGQDGEPLFLTTPAVNQGTNTNEYAPQNNAFLIQKRSDVGGRRNRGRLFMPAVAEAGVDDVGNLSPSNLADLQSRANDWLEAIETDETLNTQRMVILHSTAPSTPTVVTSLQVAPQIATQRRRLR